MERNGDTNSIRVHAGGARRDSGGRGWHLAARLVVSAILWLGCVNWFVCESGQRGLAHIVATGAKTLGVAAYAHSFYVVSPHVVVVVEPRCLTIDLVAALCPFAVYGKFGRSALRVLALLLFVTILNWCRIVTTVLLCEQELSWFLAHDFPAVLLDLAIAGCVMQNYSCRDASTRRRTSFASS